MLVITEPWDGKSQNETRRPSPTGACALRCGGVFFREGVESGATGLGRSFARACHLHPRGFISFFSLSTSSPGLRRLWHGEQNIHFVLTFTCFVYFI